MDQKSVSVAVHAAQATQDPEVHPFWKTPIGRTIGAIASAVSPFVIGLILYSWLHPLYSRVQHERALAESYVKQHYVMSDAGRNLRIDAPSQSWWSVPAVLECNVISEHCYHVFYRFNTMESATVRRVQSEWLVTISERSGWKYIGKENSVRSDAQFDFHPEPLGPHIPDPPNLRVTATPTNTEARMLFVSDLS